MSRPCGETRRRLQIRSECFPNTYHNDPIYQGCQRFDASKYIHTDFIISFSEGQKKPFRSLRLGNMKVKWYLYNGLLLLGHVLPLSKKQMSNFPSLRPRAITTISSAKYDRHFNLHFVNNIKYWRKAPPSHWLSDGTNALEMWTENTVSVSSHRTVWHIQRASRALFPLCSICVCFMNRRAAYSLFHRDPFAQDNNLFMDEKGYWASVSAKLPGRVSKSFRLSPSSPVSVRVARTRAELTWKVCLHQTAKLFKM